MTNESLECRIAKLESLLMKNEAMSLPELEDAMEVLSGLNASNQLDSGNFRWSTAANCLSSLMDSYDEDEIDAKDIARIKRNLEKAGYTSAADLVTEMITNVTRQSEKLKTAVKNLKEMLRIAKKFDKDYLA